MEVSVRVPATSANLGPGFDCLGLALDVWSTVTVRTVEGRSPPEATGGRLVRQGVQAAFGGKRVPRLDVNWDENIPLARGLGASAALRAAGLLAGNAMVGGKNDIEALFAMGTDLETHPDNMAPALFGGLQVSLRGINGLLHLGATLPAGPEGRGLRAGLRDANAGEPAPPAGVALTRGRRVQLQPRGPAAGRAGLLPLRPPGRGDAGPPSPAGPRRDFPRPGAHNARGPKDAGAAAAYLSGGGSTVAAFALEAGEAVAAAMARAAAEHGYAGRSIVTSPASRGAHLISSQGPPH